MMASGGAGPSSSIEQELDEDRISLIGAIFLQFVQKRGFVTLLDAIDFLKGILHFHITETQLESIRQELNREFALDDFEIRRLVYPMDDKTYVAFVNTQADSITQSLAKYGQSSEIQLFKCLMEAILQSNEAPEIGGCISEVEAVRIGRGRSEHNSEDAPLDLDHETTLNLIETLIKDGWIAKVSHKAGFFALGVRALMEFHHEILQMDLPDETLETLQRIL